MSTKPKSTIERTDLSSDNAKALLEALALLNHADELIRGLSRQVQEANNAAVHGYWERRNALRKVTQ